MASNLLPSLPVMDFTLASPFFNKLLTMVLVGFFLKSCKYLSSLNIPYLQFLEFVQKNPFSLSFTSPPQAGHFPKTSSLVLEDLFEVFEVLLSANLFLL